MKIAAFKGTGCGHPPDGRYVRRFWSPLVGADGVACYVLLAEALEEGRVTISPHELSSSLGIQRPDGMTAPMTRLATEGLIALNTRGVRVRAMAPPLTQEQESRLPERERDLHRRLRLDGRVAGSTAGRLRHARTWPRQLTATPSFPSLNDAAPAAPVLPPTFAELRERARSMALGLTRLGQDELAVERTLGRWRVHPSLCAEAASWAAERHRRQGRSTAGDEGQGLAAEGASAQLK